MFQISFQTIKTTETVVSWTTAEYSENRGVPPVLMASTDLPLEVTETNFHI